MSAPLRVSAPLLPQVLHSASELRGLIIAYNDQITREGYRALATALGARSTAPRLELIFVGHSTLWQSEACEELRAVCAERGIEHRHGTGFMERDFRPEARPPSAAKYEA